MSLRLKCDRCGSYGEPKSIHAGMLPDGWKMIMLSNGDGDYPKRMHDICGGCIEDVQRFLAAGEPVPPTPVVSSEELRAAIGHIMAELRNLPAAACSPLKTSLETHLLDLLAEQQARISQRIYTPAPLK